jgi:methionyl-tRNA formyltransferase
MSKTAIILGSKPASVAAMLILIKRGWEVKEVVASKTQAEWLPNPSLCDVAKKLGISVVEKQSDLATKDVDLVVSYMCRALVREDALKRGKYALNFHAGPLPEYGGWAFYNVAILENAIEYGCTCHVMDNGFDTGPLVKVRRFSINPKVETALSLEKKTQLEMLLLFEEVIAQYEISNLILYRAQDLSKMRYMDRKKFENLKNIPIDSTPEAIDRISRAFWYPPYEIAYVTLPSGYKVEIIPEIVKKDIAHRYHANDLLNLLKALNLSFNY